jgi:hypothetical protein
MVKKLYGNYCNGNCGYSLGRVMSFEILKEMHVVVVEILKEVEFNTISSAFMQHHRLICLSFVMSF